MAVIDSKKLLPPSKKGGSIEKQKFLVPLQNISVKKISAGDLKPVDKESKTTGNLVGVRRKITELSVLFKDSYLIDKKERETKRKEEERRKSEQRERKLEKKVKDNKVSSNLIPSIPGQSIFDRINRFIGFTLLGYLFNKYGELLPKLIEFGKVLKPVAEFIESFAKNLLSGVINFVEFGYKAYDGTRNFVKELGGEGAAKTFDDFSKQLNLLLNGAIAASMLIISSSPKKPGGPIKPGAKPSTLPKNAKLSGYLGRDPQTKMIERRYGNDAARMYEARKSQGASVSRARADVLKRFEKFEGPQRGLGGGTGQGSILSRGVGKSFNRASLKVLGKTGTRIAKGVFGRVPIIGGLLDFAFSLAMGENPGRAAAKAVGATVGSALGTFIPVPFAGTILGGILGDIVGGALYDSLIGSSEKPQGRAEGGQVTRGGQSTVSPSRRLKTRTKKVTPRIQPQKTQPGKDVGGKLKIEELYGKDEPGTRSALRALKKSSDDVKKMRSINGLTGSMFGAGIDMALGQKPDKKLAKSIGDVFGSVVQNAVDAELNNSFGDISKTIAMANGGVVPSREIGRSLSIGERIGKFISSALTVSIESSAAKILQNLRNEMNLEGGPAGSMPDGTGGGPLTQSQQESFELIRKIAEKVGSPNPSVTAAIAMLETGWLSNPNSVYFASGKTNPFGQTGRGPKGSVVGADGQEHAVYNNLEEGVKAHVDRWKSSYIGKTPQEIIESIRTGRGTSAPGMYNVSPSWTSKVLSTYQSGTQPRISPASVSGNVKDTGIKDSSGRPIKLKGVIADAFIEMAAAARKDGIDLGRGISNALRDPEHNRRVGGAQGSRHLTGEAFDINWNSTAGKWIRNNASRFGFRYNPYSSQSTHFDWIGGYTPQSAKRPTPKPDTRQPSPPPSQVRTEMTRKNQWDPSQSGLKFNKKTGMYEKASLAPSQSSAVASLNRSGVLKEDTSTMIFNNNAVAILPIEVAAGVA